MKLLNYIRPMNFSTAFGNLALTLRMFGFILLVPLIVSLVSREFTYTFLFAVLAFASYLVGFFGKYFGESDMTGKDALVVTALSYLIYSLIGACAYLPISSYVDGFFESMSGFTTTGLTVINPEIMPATLLFFRSYSQWIGGAGIMILSLIVLVGPGRNAFKLYTAEYGEQNLLGDVKATARIVMAVYMSITVLGFVVFKLTGISYFESLLTILTTVSTGGFSSYQSSLGYYYSNNFFIAAVIFFMFLGAIGFPTYYLLLKKKFGKTIIDVQIRYLLIIAAVASLFMIIAWQWRPEKLLSAIFTSVTSLTTTGFSLSPTSDWPSEVKLISIILMIIGGSSGSTAGGLKLFRFVLMLKLVKWFFNRMLLPREARLPLKIGDLNIEQGTIRHVLTFLFLYIMFILLTTITLSFYGHKTVDSLFEATSALGTVGLSTGITSAELPVIPKLLLAINMWAGRLEILSVLILFYPPLWIPKRRRK